MGTPSGSAGIDTVSSLPSRGADVLVEGAIIDDEGVRSGYVRFRAGRIVDTGKLGTDSTRGRERRVRGIVVPRPVNGHTHLGDAAYEGEPPHQPLEQIVAAPDGLKFRLLRDTPRTVKRRAMRDALRRMARGGVAAVIDFREEGIPGVQLWRQAARGLDLEALALGRPLARPLDRRELSELLEIADGVGLSSAREETREFRTAIGEACRARGKHFALHASESARESVDDYLRPRPDLLVHLTSATEEDLEQVAAQKVAVAVCPRSNALFGRRPDLALHARLGLNTLLGTDNAMFHAPSIWRELEFAYVSARLAGRPVAPEFLAAAAFVHPWRWLGQPERAHIARGSPADPLVVRLPTEAPAYQLVTRTTEHLISRPGSRAAGGGRRR